jgi:Kef-type K+ transport system membrane component KefB
MQVAVEAVTLVAGVVLFIYLAKLLRLPDFLGALVGGVVVGHHGLGLLQPGAESHLLFKAISIVGLIALMVEAGAASHIKDTALSMSRILLCVGAALPAILIGFGTAHLVMLPIARPRIPDTELAVFGYRALLGLAVAITSLPFLAKIFSSLRLLGTGFAREILAVACLTDVLIWGLYSALGSYVEHQSISPEAVALPFLTTLAFVGGAVLVAPRLLKLVARLGAGPVPQTLLSFAVLALLAGIGAVLNVKLMVNALVLGYVHAAHLGDRLRVPAAIAHGARHVLVPFYFGAVGLTLNIRVDVELVTILVFIAWSSAIKIGVMLVTVQGLVQNLRTALTHAISLNTRGGPGIVLATLALADKLIDARTYVALIAASFITAAITEMHLRRERERLVATVPALASEPAVPEMISK